MAQKFRVQEIKVKSWLSNRSGIITENMTSSTADKLVGTTFKSVLVNENWEFVVWESSSTQIARIHLDSWTLIQGNIYPDYQEQTMGNGEKYLSIELPSSVTNITVTEIKTILHDDTTRGSIVINVRKNWTSVHTITLPNWTSTVTTSGLSISFVDWNKFSLEITTADAGNTIWAEIFLTYNLS